MLFNYPENDRFRWWLLTALVITLLIGTKGSAEAVGRIALLPLADISIDYNGVDLETTAVIAEVLDNHGFKLVENIQVRSFLANNHLYHTGTLNSFNARKMGHELNCETILMGTILETASSQDQARFGVVLSAVSTQSGKSVWSLKESSDLKEEIALLGIGQPHSLAELKDLVFSRMQHKLSKHLQTPVHDQHETENLKPFQITDLRITPSYVKSGGLVETFLRLSCLEDYPDKITITDGAGKSHPLDSENTPGEYRGSWATPQSDNNYSASLVLEWLSGKRRFLEPEIVTYRTCSVPPELKVQFKQGFDKGDITIFSKQLLILSQSSSKRPMAAWQVKVAQSDGRIVMEETYDGSLPGRLFWQGCDRGRKPLPDGLYKLYLKVWDAAGNNTVVEKKVSIQRACNPLSIKTTKRDGKNFIVVQAAQATTSDLTPLWKLGLYSPEGKNILKTSGAILPVEIELPDDYQENFVLCELEAQDLIGNRFSLSEERVSMPDYDHQQAKHHGEKHWSEDF